MSLEQTAVDQLRDAFLTSARERIKEMDVGLRAACAKPADWVETRERLTGLAHDIAGQGSNFGYPLMTQIGRSLEALLKTLTIADPRGQRLAVTHVAALRTVLENDIKGHGGAAGAALLARLQDLTRKAG